MTLSDTAPGLPIMVPDPGCEKVGAVVGAATTTRPASIANAATSSTATQSQNHPQPYHADFLGSATGPSSPPTTTITTCTPSPCCTNSPRVPPPSPSHPLPATATNSTRSPTTPHTTVQTQTPTTLDQPHNSPDIVQTPHSEVENTPLLLQVDSAAAAAPALATASAPESAPAARTPTTTTNAITRLAPARDNSWTADSEDGNRVDITTATVTGPMNNKTKTTTAASSSTHKMIFSDLYKSSRSPLNKLRHSVLPSPLELSSPDYDPDLVSKDKTRQKEAVKRYLAEKVKNDWEFTWPAVTTNPASQNDQGSHALDDNNASPNREDVIPHTQEDGAQPIATNTDTNPEGTDNELEDESDAVSVYSSASDDPLHYRPRLAWASDLSDDDDDLPYKSLSPFRFDTPEAIGASVRQNVSDKAAQRRREVREEMEWNKGLACFEARRNAWTCAKTVRVRASKMSPSTSISPLSPRRFFSRNSLSPNISNNLHSNDASNATSDGSDLLKDKDATTNELTTSKTLDSVRSATSARSAATSTTTTRPIHTLLPIPLPILPPNNPMRASITPAVYISLYEKVILHNLTPSCPINLSDMIRACVTGWKRDGEWPPRSAADPATLVAVRKKKRSSIVGGDGSTARRMSFGFLGRSDRTAAEGDAANNGGGGGGKGIRKSLQRVLGIGSHAQAAPAAAQGVGNMA